MNKSKLTQKELEKLIGRYFDAETSEHEEADLRMYLIRGEYSLTPAVKEALAVMSLSARMAATKPRRRAFFSAAGIAASLAIIASVAAQMHHAENPGTCEMYIAGVQISDYELVMESIEADLKELGEASASGADVVGGELSEFMNLVTNDTY